MLLRPPPICEGYPVLRRLSAIISLIPFNFEFIWFHPGFFFSCFTVDAQNQDADRLDALIAKAKEQLLYQRKYESEKLNSETISTLNPEMQINFISITKMNINSL